MKVVYAKEPHPTEVVKSIFLAGPTPRDKETKSWRPEALKILEDLGFDGHVFVPEPRDGKVFGDYVDQVEWEEKALHQADVIVFWVPRDLKTMPALTTNVEWGLWADTGKVVLGTPPEAQKVQYLQHMATKLKVANYSTLDTTLEDAVKNLGEGSLRVGGEAQVPLLVWKHPTFQRWYKSQTAAGNRLDSARVLWTFRLGQQRDKVFFWCLHVGMWITAENRPKTNEFVLGRSDISSVALLYRPEEEGSSYLWDTEVLLVKEFRSPARTRTGFIAELPGGSAHEDKGETKKVALEELREETSFTLDPARLKELGTLQLAGTLSAHTSTLFYSRITKDERDKLVSIAKSGETFGVEADTEKTYVEIRKLRDLITPKENLPNIDWSSMGMILWAMLNSNEGPGPYSV
jgi:8-oxo-dGTP pyrophosphatase MutT (NUDIX family)/nucleoside 2-deoxyribosyltransferase